MQVRKGMAAGVAMAVLALQSVAFAAPEVYEFDKVHSQAGFKVRHFFSQVPGRFDEFTGTVHWDEADPTKSMVEIVIQATSINTGSAKRDEHLRSADFFDVAKFPTLTFKSSQIAPAGTTNRFKVRGDLNMRGVTKSIDVDLEVLGVGDTPIGKRAGFIATAKINRQDFGVSWNKALDKGGTVLSDEVTVEFPIEAAKTSD